MFDTLITAAGIADLNTSAQAALVAAGAFPLMFLAYKLYRKVIGRVG